MLTFRCEDQQPPITSTRDLLKQQATAKLRAENLRDQHQWKLKAWGVKEITTGLSARLQRDRQALHRAYLTEARLAQQRFNGGIPDSLRAQRLVHGHRDARVLSSDRSSSLLKSTSKINLIENFNEISNPYIAPSFYSSV
jgi:hypothetical protein